MKMKKADILRKAFRDCGIAVPETALTRTLPDLEGLECTLVCGEMPQSMIGEPFIWANGTIEVPDRAGAPAAVHQPDLPLFEPGPSTADGHRTIQLTLKF